MKRSTSAIAVAAVFGAMIFCAQAQDKAAAKPSVKKSEAAAKDAATKPAAQAAKAGVSDTLVIKARLVEVPGTFPPNDLYNYVYIMKYRVLEVVKGSYPEQEILVGIYNPLIPRKQVKDKMDKFVDGDVDKFEEGGKHVLTLVTPIDKVWKDAKEDEYFDVEDGKKFYALKADVMK